LLAVISEVQSRFIADTPIGEMFKALLDRILSLAESEYGFIGEVRKNAAGKPYLKTFALTNIAWDEETLHLYKEHEAQGMEFYNLDTLFGAVLRTGKHIIANDPANDLQSGGLPPGHPPLHSFLGLALKLGDRMVGMVGLANRPGGYDDDFVAYLAPLASTCATVIEAARNLQKRRAAEAAFRESENRYRCLFESSPDAIVILEDFRFIDCNGEAERLFATPRSGLLGNSPFAFSPEYQPDGRPSREKVAEIVRRAQKEGSQRFEWRHKRGDGTVFDAEITVSVMESETGRRFQGIIRDITARKQMERELIRAKNLESLGYLAGGIAHDFNNMLTGVFGNIELARMNTDPRNPVYRWLTEAGLASVRAQELTRRLLTFSPGGAPSVGPVDLETIVRESISRCLNGTDCTGEVIVRSDVPPAKADRRQMRQLIDNLIENAREAMPEGGTISVVVENETVANESPLPLGPGRYVHLGIRDTGRGIPPENFSRIYDPYFTTKDPGSPGTGLGLAICHSVVDRHGGFIHAESEPSRGSVFHVYLPAAQETENEALKTTDTVADGAPAGDKRRILLMDEDDTVARVGKDILEYLGYDVTLVADGKAAVAVYEKPLYDGRPFDAVILDLTVRSGMGAVWTLNRLRQLDPRVKVVVSSGFATDPVIERYPEHGFDAVIVKPYNVREIERIIKRLIV